MSQAITLHQTAELRDARQDDCPAIQAIYADHVLHGVASFEETPPDLAEIQRRVAAVQSAALPYLVAEASPAGGDILGFAAVGPYRTRPAYRYTLETTVYIRRGLEGRGIGSLLLPALIERSEALGFRQLVAVIGDSENLASIGLHKRHGFREAGVLRAIGFKHGRWLDSVLMQRALGKGGDSPPDG
ncbi:GNAT family N-acetyltransferase [Pelagibius sp.]|uniref:GNAT family N-acetyltransferase n=1 Tax=Pelagibius sp. TaxID=1931238 RepID=UPI003B50D1E4